MCLLHSLKPLACFKSVVNREEMYEIKLKEPYLTRAKFERYIEVIENDNERLIIRLRCINNMAKTLTKKKALRELTTLGAFFMFFFIIGN